MVSGKIYKDEGLPKALGNKGTLAKYQSKQEKMSLVLGMRVTKPCKLEDRNKVNKFIEMWGNFGREQGSPLADSHRSNSSLLLGTFTWKIRQVKTKLVLKMTHLQCHYQGLSLT